MPTKLQHNFKKTEVVEKEESGDVVAATPSTTKKVKRTFSLYEFTGKNAPKTGGNYSGTPLQAALKAANRWVIPKDSFDEKYTFKMIETTRNRDKKIYEFSMKRIKLEKPKVYKRGDKEITVSSKILTL